MPFDVFGAIKGSESFSNLIEILSGPGFEHGDAPRAPAPASRAAIDAWPWAARQRPDKPRVQVGSKNLFRSVDVPCFSVVSPRSRSYGEVPERSIGAVSKTVVLLTGDRGF